MQGEESQIIFGFQPMRSPAMRLGRRKTVGKDGFDVDAVAAVTAVVEPAGLHG